MKTRDFIKYIFLLSLSVLLFVSCNNQKIDTSKNDVSEVKINQPQTHIVEIKDMSFQPAELIVHKGDTVVWINKDIVAHDVTEENKAWSSSPLVNDSSFKKAITKSEAYYCSIHVIMKGHLTVGD